MGSEEPAETGYLHVLHQGFLKKSWLQKYCALYDSSRHGVKRLEVYDSEESFSRHAQQKCITLEDCIKVVPALQKNQPNVFEVHTRTHCQHFSADSYGEMTQWIEAIRGVSFGQQAVSNPAAHDSTPVGEENTLYGSLDAPHVFRVRTLPTEAAERCGLLHGSFFLLVGPRGVTLAERGPQGSLGPVLLWWPYYSIRRYGLLASTFSLEAGRKAASGEGLFSWHAADAEDIYRAVASCVRASADGSALLEQLGQHCYENVTMPPSPPADDDDDAGVPHVSRNGAEYAVVQKPGRPFQ